MKHILIIDDDQMNAFIIAHYLEMSGQYQTQWAENAADALAALDQPFDAILLDIMLPDQDGIDLCEQIRRQIFCPIIFISCIDEEDTMIRALQTGGDDYLVKPFSNELLRAKVDANIRRVEMMQDLQGSPLQGKSFSLDSTEHALHIRGKRFHLSTIEYEILVYLLEHPRQAVTPEAIFEAVWHSPSYGDVRTVISHIYSLRRKLEEDPHNPQILRSVRGYGYFFDPEGS